MICREDAATAYLGLDVGNTRLSAALIADGGRVLALRRGETPPSADEAIDRLVELATAVIADADESPVAVGIGFGGPVDTRTGRVRTSFLSSGWEGIALGSVLADRFGVSTWLANDADAAGLGEVTFGAGRGAQSALYVNVGTGIGGAVILDGRVRVGATSSAGEIGHMVVSPDGPRCECGKRGCLQALSSGTAIARHARALLSDGRGDAAGSPLAGLSPEDLTGRRVGEAALEGDATALVAVAEAARWLGLALANAAHLLDPERIIVGGGVTDLGEVFLEPVRGSYRSQIFGPATDTPVVRAELGYDAGAIGAGAVAMAGAGARSEPEAAESSGRTSE
ncbi:MAG: ROK family protein [Armatimonadota bacterium]|jgi:glucokinase